MINNYSEITGNIEDFTIENMIPKRKINCDLLQPGYLPELDVKLAEYQRANNVIDESNLKIDLVNKQINFVNKYMGRLLDE